MLIYNSELEFFYQKFCQNEFVEMNLFRLNDEFFLESIRSIRRKNFSRKFLGMIFQFLLAKLQFYNNTNAFGLGP